MYLYNEGRFVAVCRHEVCAAEAMRDAACKQGISGITAVLSRYDDEPNNWSLWIGDGDMKQRWTAAALAVRALMAEESKDGIKLSRNGLTVFVFFAIDKQGCSLPVARAGAAAICRAMDALVRESMMLVQLDGKLDRYSQRFRFASRLRAGERLPHSLS